jgi:hypothetical protein
LKKNKEEIKLRVEQDGKINKIWISRKMQGWK